MSNPICSYCGDRVNIPCETACEEKECEGAALKRMRDMGGHYAFPTEAHGEALKAALKGDNVMHPPHYARWPMEPIEFIAINNMPWWMANVVKYTMRYDAKDGLQDLYKARSYLEMKIRQLEGFKRFWDKPVAEERALK